MSLLTVFALVPFYLLGSFPTGLILAKQRNIDLSSQGSGNVGATNVARVLGKRAGLLALTVDLLKGFLAGYLGELLSGSSSFGAMAGTCAVFGHCFSIPPILKGGKGVATSFGVFIYLSPLGAFSGLLAFSLTFLLSKIVSLSSLVAAFVAPTANMVFGASEVSQICGCIISLLVIARHKDNLFRLINGHEKKFGRGV